MSVDDRDQRLRGLITAAAENDAVLDPAEVRNRARRTHASANRYRRTAIAVAAALILVVVPSSVWLLGSDDSGRVELAEEAEGLAEVTSAAMNPPDLVPLTDEQRALEPTRIPVDARRCSGPAERDDGIIVTGYCHDQGLLLELWRGSHDALPETGSPVAVAERVGYYDVAAGRPQLTVSDDNSLDDTHYRLILWSGDVSPAAMAAVLASIDAIDQAPPTPGD